MATRRCPKCSINYPSGMLHLRCAACGATNVYEGSRSQHKNWQDRVAQRQEYLKDREDAKAQAAVSSTEEGEALDTRKDVVGWRFSELLRVGYDPRTARRLSKRVSGDDKVDLEEARHLVESGCEPAVAVKILT